MTAATNSFPGYARARRSAYANPDTLRSRPRAAGRQAADRRSRRAHVNDGDRVDVPLRLYGPGDVHRHRPARRHPHRPAAAHGGLRAQLPRLRSSSTPRTSRGCSRPPRPERTDGCDRGSCLVVVERGEDVRAALAGGPARCRCSTLPASRAARPRRVVGMGARARSSQADPSQPVEQILASQPEREPVPAGLPAPPGAGDPRTSRASCRPSRPGGRPGWGWRSRRPTRTASAPAWDRDAAQVRAARLLPVGVRHRRRRRLRDARAPAEAEAGRADVGRRPLARRRPAVRAARRRPARVRGRAGRPRASFTRPAPSAEFRQALRDLLNPGRRRPVVAPPVYGSRQAAQAAVPGRRRAAALAARAEPRPAPRARSPGSARGRPGARRSSSSPSAWEQLGDAGRGRAARAAARVRRGGPRLGRCAAASSRWTPGGWCSSSGPAHARAADVAGDAARVASHGRTCRPSFSSASFRRAAASRGDRGPPRARRTTPDPASRDPRREPLSRPSALCAARPAS